MKKGIRFTNAELQEIDRYSHVHSTFTGVVKYLINQGMQNEIKKDDFIDIIREEINKEMFAYREKIEEQNQLIKEQRNLIIEYLKSEGISEKLIEKNLRTLGEKL